MGMKLTKVLFLLSFVGSAMGMEHESVNATMEDIFEDVTDTLLEGISAVEEVTTEVTSSASGLVQQIVNGVLGTEEPTAAPTVYVKPLTQADQIIGMITDTVNTVGDATAEFINSMNEAPTP